MASLEDLNLNKELYKEVGEPEVEKPTETPAETFTSGEIDGDLNLLGGSIQSSNFVTGTTGWQLTPTSGEINFALSVNSLDIPDTTTANSFHVESDGDTFWGATNADFTSDNDNAAAFVLKTGEAKFQNISIGGTTTQYKANDDGIFSFGDGSDGASTTSGDVTLTEDKYFTNLTISDGDTFKPDGFRIFVNGTFTIGGGTSGIIDGNGNNGANASGGVAGAGGAALADGYLKGSLVGGTGGTGGGAEATAGGSTSNSIGSNGAAGGNGGNDGAGGAGGAGGTATASNVKLIANWHLATLLDVATSGSTVKFDNSGSAGGGGRGFAGGFQGGGGGGASGGRIIAIYARNIVISANAIIRSNGGNGGNGGDGGTGSAGGGGGGGGNGGQVILVFNSLTNNGSIILTAGTGGTGGSGQGGSEDGDAGSNGTAGTIRQFSLSL